MAKKSIWTTIKNWFTGNSNSKKNRASAGIAQKNQTNGDTASAVRSAFEEAARKSKEQEEAQRQAWQKAEADRKAKNEERAKEAIKAKQGGNSAQASNFRNALKSYSDTVKSEANKMGVAPQVAQQLGSNKIKAQDIKSSYKAMPMTTAFSEGAVRGATMGLSDIARNNANKTVKKTLNNADKNLTTAQKHAKIAGELAGSMVTFSGTSGISEKLGSKAINALGGSEAKAVEKLANSNFVKNYATKLSKKAGQEITANALAKSFYKELSTDLGMELGVGNIMDLTNAIETNGDLKDKLGSYVSSKVFNTIVGVPINKLQAGKGAINAGRKALAEELGTETAKTVKNLPKAYTEVIGDTNVYFANRGIGQTIKDSLKGTDASQKTVKELAEQADDAITNIKNLVAEGREKEARKLASDTADKIFKNVGAKVEEDGNEKAIKDYFRNTKIGIGGLESDVNYSEGFRKTYQGKLKINKGTANVDKVAQELHDLYPEYFDNAFMELSTADQLKYMANVVDAVSTKKVPLPDDELAYNKNSLAKKLMNMGSKGVKKSEPPTQAISDELASELPSAKEQADMDAYLQNMHMKENADLPVETKVSQEAQQIADEDPFVQRLKELASDVNAKRNKKGKIVIPKEDYETLGNMAFDSGGERANELAKLFDNFAKGKATPKAKAKAEAPEINTGNVYKQSKGGKMLREELSNMQEEAKLGEGGSIGEGDFKVSEKSNYQDIKTTKVEDVAEMNARYEIEKLLATEEGRIEYMSRNAVTDLRSATSDAERQVINEAAELGSYNHTVEHNRENTIKAVERLKNDANAVFKRITDYANGTTDIGSRNMLEAEYDMYATLSMSGKKIDEFAKAGLSESTEAKTWRTLYEDSLKGLHDLTSISGQVEQLRGAMVKCTPEGRVSIATKDAVNLIYKSGKWRNAYGKELGITIDKYNAKQFAEQYINSISELKDAFRKIENALTEEEAQQAFLDFYKAVNEYVPNTVIDYMLEYRYVSMLFNVATHERNIISNMAFSPIRDATNSLAYVMERVGKTLGKIESDQAYTHGAVSPLTTIEALKKNSKSGYGKLADESLDLNRLRGNTTKYESIGLTDKENRRFKAIGKISKFNSWLLEKADEFFLRVNYKKNFIALCKANHLGTEKQVVKDTDALVQMIKEQATNEAQISTFREYNDVAEWLNKQTKGLTDTDRSKRARAGGLILNANFPFARTTANITKQIVRYTPEGIVEGVARLAMAGKSGNAQEVSKALDALCSGVVGTGIIGLGYVAAKSTDGIFHAQFDDDDNAGTYQKGLGIQDFSITIDGKNYGISSISPASAPFLLGVRLSEITERAQKESATVYDKLNNIEEVLSSLMSVGFEQTMLASINYQIDSLSRDTETSSNPIYKLGDNLLWSYVGSFIPAQWAKIARTFYETDKQMPKSTNLEYQINNLRYKAGLAGTNILGEKLGARTDDHGNTINDVNTLGFAKKFARNVLSPFPVKDVNISEGDKALVDTYYDAIKNGSDPEEESLYQLFPYAQSKREQKIGKKESGKETITMSNLDLAEYNKARTKSGKEIVTAAVKSSVFDGLSNSEKKKLIDSAPESGQDALTMLTQTDAYKNADLDARKSMSQAMWIGSGKSQGYKKAGQMAVWESQGKDKYDYLFLNDISAERQIRYNQNYKDVVSKQKMVEFNEGAISNKGSFTVESMYSFLNSTNWSEAEKAACFNSFKAPKTKPYSSAKASLYGVGNDPWADVDESESSSGSSSSSSGSSSSKSSSSNKSKAPDMGTTRTKSKYKDVGSTVKKKKSVKNVVELKSNYSSKLKPPTAKW